MLKFVNIKLNPDLFIGHLLMHTSRKFISSLFKLKLNLGNSKEEFAMVLRKNNFNEEADNLWKTENFNKTEFFFYLSGYIMFVYIHF